MLARITFSATLPRMARATPLRPWKPTITSAGRSSSMSCGSTSSGNPSRSTVRASGTEPASAVSPARALASNAAASPGITSRCVTRWG